MDIRRDEYNLPYDFSEHEPEWNRFNRSTWSQPLYSASPPYREDFIDAEDPYRIDLYEHGANTAIRRVSEYYDSTFDRFEDALGPMVPYYGVGPVFRRKRAFRDDERSPSLVPSRNLADSNEESQAKAYVSTSHNLADDECSLVDPAPLGRDAA